MSQLACEQTVECELSRASPKHALFEREAGT